MRRETKARNPSPVRTAGLFARKFTSFTLCHYVIGLFNRAQTNHKHKRKRMLFGCEQPFLWEERCVTSQKTAAEETMFTNSALETPPMLHNVSFPPVFFLVKIRQDASVKWGWLAYRSSTVDDIGTFAVLCSVTRPFCRFTRVYEGHFMLCYKEELKVQLSR